MVKSDAIEKLSIDKLNRSQAEQTESISKLCSQMYRSRLAAPEPDIVSGEPFEFNAWFNSFQTLVSNRSISESEFIFT